MSNGAWVFMVVSWLFVIGLNLFCFLRLLSNSRKQ